MQTVLTIAGFDPSSGAGITADLMVFAAHGLFGTSCITSLTIQSTLGVLDNHPIPAETVRATLDCLYSDLPPVGIKIGMMATARNVSAVADYLTHIRAHAPQTPIVLDPVLRSSSGRELLDLAGVQQLRDRLLPLVDWITPNTDELSLLANHPVNRRDDIPKAAPILRQDNPQLNVFATGGHFNPPDDFLLTATGSATWLPGKHIDSTSTHGTGCALSSALLSRLVLGDTPEMATHVAKQYVAEAIRSAHPLGQGRGPLNHLWTRS